MISFVYMTANWLVTKFISITFQLIWVVQGVKIVMYIIIYNHVHNVIHEYMYNYSKIVQRGQTISALGSKIIQGHPSLVCNVIYTIQLTELQSMGHGKDLLY